MKHRLRQETFAARRARHGIGGFRQRRHLAEQRSECCKIGLGRGLVEGDADAQFVDDADQPAAMFGLAHEVGGGRCIREGQRHGIEEFGVAGHQPGNPGCRGKARGH